MPRILTVVLLAAFLLHAPARADDAEANRKPEDIVKAMKDRDRTVKLAAIADAKTIHDPAITSELTKLLRDEDRDLRIAAIRSLETREGKEKSRAARALGARLARLSSRLSDAEEYELVIATLGKLADPSTIKPLLDFNVHEAPETAKARLMAVAEVLEPEAIDALITFASKGRNRGSNGQHRAAVEALVHATGQKLGNDPDKWRSWWREARSTYDFEARKEKREEERRAAEEKAARREERKRRREEREREEGGQD